MDTNLFLIYTKIRDVKDPVRANEHDAGLDFFVPEDMEWESFLLAPNCQLLIPTGIKINIPRGTALICLEKSGVAAKKQLIVGAKVCDSGYTGEIHIHIINVGKEKQVIKRGDKIAQFVLIPVFTPIPISTTQKEFDRYATGTQRGEGGFGSTGT